MIVMIIIPTIHEAIFWQMLAKVECVMRCELRWVSFGSVLTPASGCSGHRQNASREQHPSQKGRTTHASLSCYHSTSFRHDSHEFLKLFKARKPARSTFILYWRQWVSIVLSRV
jgi:hypothetical protein